MSLADALPSLVAAALAFAVIAGLVRRRKTRACFLFAAYLSVTVAGHSAIVLSPAVFWNWTFWALSDLVHTALCTGVAFEVAVKALRALPRSDRHVRVAFLGLMLAVLGAVLLYPREYGDAFELAQVVGWVTYGVSAMFTAFLVLAWHYGVPLDPLHRAIAAGFAIVGAFLAFEHSLPEGHSILARGQLGKATYPLVLAFWTWAAWRKDDLSHMSPEAIARLWPWRRP